MPDLTRTLGILGLVAACGPVAPQDDTSGGSTSGATSEGTSAGSATESDPSDPTSAGTTDPTTATSEPTSTTTPPPECESESDCSEVYCGYCDQGVCKESVGCCGGYESPPRPEAQRWRCEPPYECYSDMDCAEDQACEFGRCIAIPGALLPPCEELGVLLEQWNLGAMPGAFVLADLDADGDLDLAATQPSVGLVEIMLNDGAGQFKSAGTFAVGGASPSLAIAAGDLDGDADNDLAVVRGDPMGGLVLAFGAGAVFAPEPTLPTSPEPTAVLIDELDAPLADVLVVTPGGVFTRLGEDLSVEKFAIVEEVGAGASLFDIDVDTRLDLIATIPGTTAVGAWSGGKGGSFTPAFSIDTFVVQTAALAADLDLQPQPPQDDLPALILTTIVEEHGEIAVWAGINAPEMFAEPVIFRTSLPITGATMLELGESQGPDVLAATGSASVLVVLGDGVGGFACERVLPVPMDTVQTLLAAGDLDGDGRSDFVVGHPNSSLFSVLRAP